MTTKDASEMLNISVVSISRLINRGILQGEKFGPVWMVKRESVEEYARRNEGKSKHDPTRRQTE